MIALQEVKGKLIVATVDGLAEEIMGPFLGHTTIHLHGTNSYLKSIHGSNPRETPEKILGKEGLRMGPASLNVAGEMIMRGRPSSHSWTTLSTTSAVGQTYIVVEDDVDWKANDEIIITPTDYDAHQADVKRVVSTAQEGSRTRIELDSALEYDHFAGETKMYGTKSMRMQAKVGLLSRNIVIQGGEGQGEDVPYQRWNSQGETLAGTAECGNLKCEVEETSIGCPSDCRGPAYEFGASILVASYTVEGVYCNVNQVCYTDTLRAKQNPVVHMDSVEMRYFGQNNLRAGIEVHQTEKAHISNVSLNRGYFHGFSIINCTESRLEDNVFFRTHLPGLRIVGGQSNRVERNLGISSIFWNTHRGAIHPSGGLNYIKLSHMIGMFHEFPCDEELCGRPAMAAARHRKRCVPNVFFGTTHWKNNVAAGSERAGFSGIGVSCDGSPSGSFIGNEAVAALTGYQFDSYHTHRPYLLPIKKVLSCPFERTCVQLSDFKTWKIRSYGKFSVIFSLLTTCFQSMKDNSDYPRT